MYVLTSKRYIINVHPLNIVTLFYFVCIFAAHLVVIHRIHMHIYVHTYTHSRDHELQKVGIGFVHYVRVGTGKSKFLR